MVDKLVRIDEETYNDIKILGIKEYRRNHPEMKKIPISMKKIIYEMKEWYLR